MAPANSTEMAKKGGTMEMCKVLPCVILLFWFTHKVLVERAGGGPGGRAVHLRRQMYVSMVPANSTEMAKKGGAMEMCKVLLMCFHPPCLLDRNGQTRGKDGNAQGLLMFSILPARSTEMAKPVGRMEMCKLLPFICLLYTSPSPRDS